MKAPSNATYFERRVARVFEAVEKLGVEVTWNAKIKDPHTGQTRQIDVMLKQSNGRTTCVECRDRTSVQDVMWIEELSGRQRSMNFDKVFAVSSSGFTKPAIAKAQALGVTLFKLSSFEVEATKIALVDPAVYILCADQVNIQCFAKSDQFSKDTLRKLLSQNFFFELEKFYEAVEGLKSSKNDVLQIGKRAVRSTSFTTNRKVDGVDVEFFYDLKARLFWHRFELKPFYFRKLKPGEVSTSAVIYDDELTSGISAELIVTQSRLDISLDYQKNNSDWHDRYHFCSAQIFYEGLLDREIRLRQIGRTQIQFSFRYDVL